MAKKPEQRIAVLEKVLGLTEGQRRVCSHAQLVEAAHYLEKHGALPGDLSSVVGRPELVIGKDEPSPAELVAAAAGSR